ncbi:MAG: T9SS type A sorting domain-containing protein [Saprospiraceae bacterium]|nr:T9SS type A sorting domain-containing protein [Saprospiraceae bacterium]
MKTTFTSFCVLVFFTMSFGQHSVARLWNEALLDAIRVDVSRPTVHSRNLFHTSAVMYDAWAVYDDQAQPFLLGNTVGDYTCNFDGINVPETQLQRRVAQEEAISYAAYRLLKQRFRNSPGAAVSLPRFDSLMISLGYDTSFTSVDFSDGSPAALGNYIALSCMEFGLGDHSDEDINYDFPDSYYTPVNPPLVPSLPGNPDIVDLNHWQPLALQAGMPRRFLGPHWGSVTPFSLTEDDLEIFDKNGNDYYLYHNPGSPPQIDTTGTLKELDDFYKWNFALVAIWSGHLDPAQQIMIDISPASVGNLSSLPHNEEEMRAFYNFLDGGVIDTGYSINPVTGQPYEPQIVSLGDFGRVLAEFWADGPNSETPPGHWFTILNYVSDYPGFEKRFEGAGEPLDNLEWDVKTYLVMGGAMHDVAVAVWGIKSFYDFVRPISAIRGMAELGQCSDSTKMSYHPGGLPLVEGHIELVEEGDSLAGPNGENIGKIKLFAWKGPDYVPDATSSAGVGWILAANWWPYQKPSFITPPFAGYVSGHSTFSRAAAEVMTLVTGDEYFPGGMGVFDAPKNEFLLFEEGPTIDLELQWAKYRDASDQASLSRLWGGIHPPIDDVPGRLLGMKIGPEAFAKALQYFQGETTANKNVVAHDAISVVNNYPNPVADYTTFEYSVKKTSPISINVYNLEGRLIEKLDENIRNPGIYSRTWQVGDRIPAGTYFYRIQTNYGVSQPQKLIVTNS